MTDNGITLQTIVSYAKSLSTPARRQPYVTLINWWAEHGGDQTAAFDAIRQITGGRAIDATNMPKEFYPRYRQPEVAGQLIAIIHKIDTVIANQTENWTWAYVMKVMIDEGIIMKMTQNKFDGIICSMIPGKGHDTVRKSGDYSILEGSPSSSLQPQPYRVKKQGAQR